MKVLPFFILFLLILLFSTSFQIFENRSINTLELLDKNFKHIVKFDSTYSDNEFQDIEHYLHKYDTTIELVYFRNEKGEIVEFEIKGNHFSCKSTDFGVGIILIDEKNHCQCAIGKIKIKR